MIRSRRPSHRSPAIVRARNAAIVKAHSHRQTEHSMATSSSTSATHAEATSATIAVTGGGTTGEPPSAKATYAHESQSTAKQDALNDLAEHLRTSYPQVAEDHTVQRLLSQIQSGITAEASPPATAS